MSGRVRSRMLGCLALTLSLPAFSGPMGFKDSWMAMGDFRPNWQEAFTNYALTPRDAIGASTLYMRSDDESKSRQLVDATYTRLVKRWNLPDAQANIWFLGGLGNVTGNDFSGSKAMASPGIQVDYETTRVYVSATTRLYRADGINHDYASARLGFSFYEVDYDEIQPWLIVEARRMNGLSDKTEVTPMLRLIHNRYFVELGVNNSSQARINFMYIF
ncbi:hypothetical protein [Rhodoferax mekongensis]|uniref:Uncharacterized protein n=1 Tax=Rhodoferax mekongensis TaxID=3068341 RepID=A0ABZ0AXW8_9BURK|nr:hypothetical protein [Rhodoferax sp. TBRC 17307]WNO03587.1 hypothetical protein RAN89_11725 [Rhodoferax sp. TBRC 17307]